MRFNSSTVFAGAMLGVFAGEQKPVCHEQGIKITPPSRKEVTLTCRDKAKAQYDDLAEVFPEPE